LFLFLTLGCGGAGSGSSTQNTLTVTPGSSWQTLFGQATIVFPAGTFANTTTVTMRDAMPPHFEDPNFHAVQRTLTISAPATANAFEVTYPDSPRFAPPVAVALNGSQAIATLPVLRQDGQVTIYVDPALIPSGTGSLQVTVCLGHVSD
jgi:hypothetical protein